MSARACTTLGLLIAVLTLGACAPAAMAGKVLEGTLGGPGSMGGKFLDPADIAVNQSTGQIYVADRGNRRIQRFDSAGNFEAAFGRGVVTGGGNGDVVGANEHQTVTAVGTAGTFTLRAPWDPREYFDLGIATDRAQTVSVVASGGTFNLRIHRIAATTTEAVTPIPFDASAVDMQATLYALPNVEPGDLFVSGPTGGPWEVRFADPALVASVGVGGLTGPMPAATTVTGQISVPIGRNASASTVASALEGLSFIGTGGVSVTGPAGGPWDVEFTGPHSDADVRTLIGDASNLTGASKSIDVLTTAEAESSFEVCTVALECRSGARGYVGGGFSGATSIAINQVTGDIYLLSGGIEKFSLDDMGTQSDPSDDLPIFERSWGWDVVKPGGSGEVLGDESQQILLLPSGPAVDGTFTVSWNDGGGPLTTAPILYNASAAEVQGAIEALSNIAPGDIAVTGPAGGPWKIEFSGSYAGLDVPQATVDGEKLVGLKANNFSAFIRVETLVNGAGFEICEVGSQCRVGGSGVEAGHVSGGTALAVSPLTGDVFLADLPNARIDQFGPDGAFKRAWGWGVDTGANQFEICTEENLCQAAVPQPRISATSSTRSPTQVGQFDANLDQFGLFFDGGKQPAQIAIDSTGIVYASNDFGTGAGAAPAPRVERFDSKANGPAGLLLPGPIGTTNPPSGFPAGPLPLGPPSGFEIDPGNDHLYYLSRSFLADSGTGIFEIDAVTNPSAPTRFDTHLQGVDSGVGVTGLGYAHGSDRLYVSIPTRDFGTTQVHRVIVAGNTGTPPPTVTLDPPSAVGPFQATFSGTVNPNGPQSISTSYRFEYRKMGAPSWTQIPAPPLNLGDGSSPLPVTRTATGLEANTDYEVKLVAAKEFGAGSTTQGPISFHTSPLTPAVQALPPQQRTDTEATLAAHLNPNGQPTTYRFEYLSEAEFQANGYANAIKAPIPDGNATGGVQIKVSEDVDDLQPATAYRYRLVATNANGTTEGEDVLFSTLATPGALPQRGFEMVTPPFKSVRSAVWPGNYSGYNPNIGVPSLTGEAMLWQVPYFPLTDEVGAPGSGDIRIIRRNSQHGWVNQTANTLPLISGSPLFVGRKMLASSGDLETQPIYMSQGQELPETGALLSTEGSIANRLYTFRPGTGSKGYTPWLQNPEAQYFGSDYGSIGSDRALLSDSGASMARWGAYRGLAEDPEAPGDEDPSDQIAGLKGSMIYLQDSTDPLGLPSAPKELANECTGASVAETQTVTVSASGGTFTLILQGEPTTPTDFNVSANTLKEALEALPGVGEGDVIVTKADSTWTITFTGDLEGVDLPQMSADATLLTGASQSATVDTVSDGDFADVTVLPSRTPSGEIGERACPAGAFLTSMLGAAVGANSASFEASSPLDGPAATALSDDGRRLFMLSPEPSQAPATCATATGSNTSCPPQLYVRQYDSQGNATVRWISRAQGVGTQKVEEMGRGIGFQGASRDGRYVYFKTNAPLLPTDPNGGESITAGKASDKSWDLYRYELPDSFEEDPPSGVLTRISGGPNGGADPSVTLNAPSGGGSTPGAGASLRFFSDDGKRAYFVTTSPIAGADATPPADGSTAPGGAVGNTLVRNLYLFDDHAEGGERYRFIAQIPFSTASNGEKGALDSCASFGSTLGYQLLSNGADNIDQSGENCFRGTHDGQQVTFFTSAQLTADDNDQAGDVYLYDAEVDALSRVSAPAAGAAPYVCARHSAPANGECNADLGWSPYAPFSSSAAGGPADTARGWGGMRYLNVAKDENGEVSVFFESRSELIPADTNGEHWDVYQWRQGKLSLLSPGDSEDHSYLSGNSKDGQDVFIWTSARIDPREVDDSDYDLYDARVGGGFPYTPPPKPCDVLGLGCEAAATLPSPSIPPATPSFNGGGNVKAKPATCRKGKVRRKGRCVAKPRKNHRARQGQGRGARR